MGLIDKGFSLIFGDGGNAVAETAKALRKGMVGARAPDSKARTAAVAHLAARIAGKPPGAYDRAIDALNRLPRPAMAFGTVGILVAAMVDPDWFAARMDALARAPEPLWWLLGAIVSFYFGARHQLKGQEFHRALAELLAAAPQAGDSADAARAPQADSPGAAATDPDAALTLAATEPRGNPAVEDWARGGG